MKEDKFISTNFLTYQETKMVIEYIQLIKSYDFSTIIKSCNDNKSFKITFKEV